MVSITRRLEIDAGHRVFGHEGKCSYLHGHRLVIEIEVTAPELDSIGRVIDFGVVKDILGHWLNKYWDHGFILYEKDTKAIEAVLSVNGDEKTYILPVNPTSENLANYLLTDICPHLFQNTEIEVVSITVWETPNCRAVARRWR